MKEAVFVKKARNLVFNYAKSNLDPTDHTTFLIDEVYFVVMTNVLNNWKALLSTTLPDGMYYEVVYNSRTDEFYLTAYKRWGQLTVLSESIVE